MNLHERLTSLRNNPDTARAGMKWSHDEDARLVEQTVNNVDIDTIAKSHKRTVASVKSRILSKALDIKDMTLEEVAKHMHVALEDLEAYKRRKDEKNEKSYKPTEPTGNIRMDDDASSWTHERDAWLLDAIHISKKDAAFCAAELQCSAESIETRIGYLKTQGIFDLNTEQRRAIQHVQQGDSIVLTGPAGTGKSHTLRVLIHWLQSENINMGVTAMTGSASLVLGGRTLHSFLGIGLANQDALKLYLKTRARCPSLLKKLQNLDTLIVDEISMATAELIDLISDYLRLVRNSDEPFGGIQMIFCGDFAQLPPVDGPYAFHAVAWKALSPTLAELKHMVRQSGDRAFQAMLLRLRLGKCNNADLSTLAALQRTVFPDGIQPTRLYARNREVDTINQAELEALIQREGCRRIVFKTEYKGTRSEGWATACGLPASVELAEGAQVVLTTNLDPENGLVNGSRGKVVSLDAIAKRVCISWVTKTTSWVPMVDMRNEDVDVQQAVSIMPLRLAWAITIHKAQGMTLDALEVDLGNSIFEVGQAYTALSRARNLASVRVVRISARAFRTHPDVIAFYKAKKT